MTKRAKASESDDDMRAEYDLSKMKLVGRGIYAERYRSVPNIVLLDSDVTEAFLGDQSVNEAPLCERRETTRFTHKKVRARKAGTRSRR